MWDLPGPGIEPASPASAGGFLTTVPPGKSLTLGGFNPADALESRGELLKLHRCLDPAPGGAGRVGLE